MPKAVSTSLIPASTAGALRAEVVGRRRALVDRDQLGGTPAAAQVDEGIFEIESVGVAAGAGAVVAPGAGLAAAGAGVSSGAFLAVAPAEVPPPPVGCFGGLLIVGGASRAGPCTTGAGVVVVLAGWGEARVAGVAGLAGTSAAGGCRRRHGGADRRRRQGVSNPPHPQPSHVRYLPAAPLAVFHLQAQLAGQPNPQQRDADRVDAAV